MTSDIEAAERELMRLRALLAKANAMVDQKSEQYVAERKESASLKALLAEAHVALFLAKAFITRDYDSLPNDINSEKAVIDHINAVLRKMEKPNG